MRLAVIDCGTNTFNLLIAETSKLDYKVIYHNEQLVLLGEEGIDTIGQDAMARAKVVLTQFAETCKSLEVHKVRAVGTEAFRKASNSGELIEAILVETGISINVISGDEEAGLIYKGIVYDKPSQVRDNVLMMDIGGGSSEFIVGSNSELLWQMSLPIGASVLKEQFQQNEILTFDEVNRLNLFLADCLREVFCAIKIFKVTTLIGSSGSFDTLADIINKRSNTVPIGDFTALTKQPIMSTVNSICRLTLKERMGLPGMKAIRADMMPVAGLLILVVLGNYNFENVYATKRALKDGLLIQFIEEFHVTLN